MAASSTIAKNMFMLAALLNAYAIVGTPTLLADTADASTSAGTVKRSVVQTVLIQQLMGVAAGERNVNVEDMLRPIFDSLPKNSDGKLNHEQVQVAAHRYFAKAHGWFIKDFGSEPSNSDSGIEVDAAVPVYLQELIEKRVQDKGMGMQELSAMALALEKLVKTAQPDIDDSWAGGRVYIFLLAIAAPSMLVLSSYVSQNRGFAVEAEREHKELTSEQQNSPRERSNISKALLPCCMVSTAILLFDVLELDPAVTICSLVIGCSFLAVHRWLPDRTVRVKKVE